MLVARKVSDEYCGQVGRNSNSLLYRVLDRVSNNGIIFQTWVRSGNVINRCTCIYYTHRSALPLFSH